MGGVTISDQCAFGSLIYLMHSPLIHPVIMECLSGYTKLEELLCAGEVEIAVPTLQKAMTVLGRLHGSTWLEECANREALVSQFK